MQAIFSRRHTHEEIEPGRGKHVLSGRQGRYIIGFAGVAAGAGATTLAFAAAEYLAAQVASPGAVAYLELDPRAEAPAGRPYDKIGIDRRFAGRDFLALYHLAAEGKPLADVCNLDGGIGWTLRLPGEHGVAPTAATLFRLLHNIAGEIIVCDIPAYAFLTNQNRDTLLALLADMDHVVCVFDPLPSRLLASVPAAEVCRAAAASGLSVSYVFNKMNAGVNTQEIQRFTGIRDYIDIPAIPAEKVYAAEYACRSLASIPIIKSALESLTFDRISISK